MRNKLLAAIVALLLSSPSYAGSGTITVLDSTGATQTFDIITDGSGNYVWKQGICDQSAAANCAGVDAGHSLQVAGEGTAGTAAGGVVTVQGVTSMTPVQVSQATAANLNATVVGTGTFAVQATLQASSATAIGTVNPTTAANWGIGATGSGVPANAQLSGGSDGTDTRAFLTDSSGREIVIGAAASGNAVAGNPVLIGGSDGTDARSLSTNSSGQLNVNNVSGTVSLPTGASTSALQPTNSAQAATTSGQTGTLMMGAVTTSAPSYTTAQTDPFSLDTAGNLRVNCITGCSSLASINGAAASSVAMQSAATGNGNGTTLTVTNYETALVNVNCSVACSGGTTVNFEGTDSTGTYFAVAAIPVGGGSGAVNTATTSGQFWVPVGGLTTIRARISAYSAGTITVTGTPMYGVNSTLAQVVNTTSISNSGSGVATTSTNSPVVNYNYGFNGTSWDQLQVDSSKNLKVTTNPGAAGAAGYPIGSTPYTATATGTTAATTATLTGASSVTTYICGFSIRANATAAATGNATVTGTITGTLNFTQWSAPLASGLGVAEEVFQPCIPASGTNASIAVVSAAPGSGGTVSVTAWGYKL